MKFKSILAFLLTSLALITIISAGVCISMRYYTRFTRRNYCEHFSVRLDLEVNKVQLEIGKGKLVKVNITNLGFEDEFRVKTKGPSWVVVKPEKIRLESGESSEIFVYISPTLGVEGKFDLMVTASSYCGSMEERIEVKV